jgi:hypothetical protein
MPTSWAGLTNQQSHDDRTHRTAGSPGTAVAALDGQAIVMAIVYVITRGIAMAAAQLIRM